ncbi:MAG TPA: dihydroorotate dehydrogenase-like protein [Perlabentimonas sp.]|nr:dihydroorotate dehydrogenase-like protein [Bacteroidales bacterium]MDD4671720.1 dihydroorotate dehydrogenase-like protein [Bacteroidales bacterium]HZJ73769.1 dihydroorotate dehydrogenase-like protein [Perlabentimonas sp.]
MKNLTVKYMGLALKNPIVAASSGLTSSLKGIKALEDSGVGAVVIKSLFEEEIIMETQDSMNRMQATGFIYPETMEYFDFDEIEDPVANYIKLISDAKREVNIPVIASINCVTAHKWPDFAKRIQEAGADALELNIFALPSDFNRTAEENEKLYFDIIERVTSLVSIPVAVKISHYNASLASFLKRLSETPIKSIVLFNRFYNPDIDINTLSFTAGNVLSSPSDLSMPLRWIAIMSERVSCDLAASTGIHDGNAVAKVLLAGASVVHVASTLYRNGLSRVGEMLKDLETWMDSMEYTTIDDFKGKMSQAKTFNPAAYERVQFMKYFNPHYSSNL